MNSANQWYLTFSLLLFGYVLVQFIAKDKRRCFIYFVAGAVLGFYFDVVSFMNGYYSYPDFYKITILGLPLSMTLAEGFSVAITIYLFNLIKGKLASGKITGA